MSIPPTVLSHSVLARDSTRTKSFLFSESLSFNFSMAQFDFPLSEPTTTTAVPPSIPPSADMEASVFAVQRILNYGFKNKRLLEEALTHSSYNDSASYQRLEFIGDAVLGLALSNHFFLAYPQLDPGQLSPLRAANISTEKLARVAIRHGLYGFVRHNAASLDDKVNPLKIGTFSAAFLESDVFGV